MRAIRRNVLSLSRTAAAASVRTQGRSLARRHVPAAVSTAARAQGRGLASAAGPTAAETKKPAMFCFQCEQTNEGSGCKVVGVCGKTPEVAADQDLLVHLVKGVSQYAHAARQIGAQYSSKEVDRFMLFSLFATVTNVNFDGKRIAELVKQAVQMRATAKALYEKACKEQKQAPASFSGPAATEVKAFDEASVSKQGETVGLWDRRGALGADYVGLQEMTMYGVKGAAAYAEHALMTGQESDAIYAGMHEVLAGLTKDNSSIDELLGNAMKVGAINLEVMALLDKGHTTRFGHPEPTQVNTTPVPGKCILVSGHDLTDLEAILKQTEGKGINVYTHGEMLPAHGYPGLKKYKHLAGHFGGPWQLQKMEFPQFPGAIVMTTNCLVEPRKSYKHRIFTRSVTGWPGVEHLGETDFSAVIRAAQKEKGFVEAGTPSKPLLVGFAHNAILSHADAVIGAIKSGAIKNFFVIGGCDGSEGERSYFSEVANAVPKDGVMLALGCGKYRYIRGDHGDIGGIPRVLDMGQCNDAYSGIQVAVNLAKALGVTVNQLPLHFVVSWFEQKAVAVLLTLLHLNIRNIRLGPKLPGFATPTMVEVLNKKFNLMPIGDVKTDMAKMLQNQ